MKKVRMWGGKKVLGWGDKVYLLIRGGVGKLFGV